MFALCVCEADLPCSRSLLMFEKEFVSWIESRNRARASVLVDVGDDACVIAPNELASVVTTDSLCDRIHFDTREHSLERIGRKSLAVSISDILAMGARPAQAVLTFFLPRSFSLSDAQQVYLGAEEVAAANGVAITGGDTNRYDGPLIVGSTLIGYVSPERIWKIDGAKIGDSILVTGSLGGSILGRHLDFQPRTEWVQKIADKYTINAATDITDSFSLDLSYLLQQSRVGGMIDRQAVPISDAAAELSRSTERSAFERGMTDGEDFELLLVTSADIADEILTSESDVVTRVGTVVEETGLWLVDNGEKTRFEPKGYVH